MINVHFGTNLQFWQFGTVKFGKVRHKLGKRRKVQFFFNLSHHRVSVREVCASWKEEKLVFSTFDIISIILGITKKRIGFLVFGFWFLVFCFWFFVFGFLFLFFGFWFFVFGFLFLVFGFWFLVFGLWVDVFMAPTWLALSWLWFVRREAKRKREKEEKDEEERKEWEEMSCQGERCLLPHPFPLLLVSSAPVIIRGLHG